MKIRLMRSLSFKEGDTLDNINKGQSKITTFAAGTVLEGTLHRDGFNSIDFQTPDGKIFYELTRLDYSIVTR